VIAKLKKSWKAAPIATVLLVLSLTIATGFTVRLAAGFFRPPPPQEVVLEEWMTPRLISHTWHVPPKILRGFLEIEQSEGRPKNLGQIAEERGLENESLIDALEAKIIAFHDARREGK
jgi:hypothetical protein